MTDKNERAFETLSLKNMLCNFFWYMGAPPQHLTLSHKNGVSNIAYAIKCLNLNVY